VAAKKDPLESEVERAGTREAKRLGALFVKLNIRGRRGWPDKLYLFSGPRVLFVEYKRKGGKARPDQDRVHQRLRRRGFAVAVIDSKEHAQKVLRDFYAGRFDSESR